MRRLGAPWPPPRDRRRRGRSCGACCSGLRFVGRRVGLDRGRAPGRLVVAPGARTIEGVDAEPVQSHHFMHPARMHPVGMVMRGVADIGEPDFAVEHFLGDFFRLLPHIRLVDLAQILAFAGEGELAGQMMVGVLKHHAADVVRIVAGEHAVHHDLRHRFLTGERLAARLEIDRLGETLFGAARAACRRGRGACAGLSSRLVSSLPATDSPPSASSAL